MVWVNDDGLRIKFGTEEALDTAIGEYGDADGSTHKTQLILSPETLGDGKIVHDSVRFAGTNGKTMYLKSATIFVEDAFTSSGTPTLTIGFDNVDGTTFDADGVDAAIALADIDADGDTVTCDGALVDTRLTNDQALYLTTTVASGSYTGGKGWLELEWYYVNP